VRDAADSTSLEITSHVSRGPTLLSRVRQLDSSVTNGRRRVKFLWANQPNAVVEGPDKAMMVGRAVKAAPPKVADGVGVAFEMARAALRLSDRSDVVTEILARRIIDLAKRCLDRVKENLGAAEMSLSDEDMAAIEARLARIEVTGGRLPPAVLKLSYR
jgi:hypothetical protein